MDCQLELLYDYLSSYMINLPLWGVLWSISNASRRLAVLPFQVATCHNACVEQV